MYLKSVPYARGAVISHCISYIHQSIHMLIITSGETKLVSSYSQTKHCFGHARSQHFPLVLAYFSTTFVKEHWNCIVSVTYYERNERFVILHRRKTERFRNCIMVFISHVFLRENIMFLLCCGWNMILFVIHVLFH